MLTIYLLPQNRTLRFLRVLGLDTHLFKVPQPGDSEGTFSVFKSSCHLLLPVELLKDRGNLIK